MLKIPTVIALMSISFSADACLTGKSVIRTFEGLELAQWDWTYSQFAESYGNDLGPLTDVPPIERAKADTPEKESILFPNSPEMKVILRWKTSKGELHLKSMSIEAGSSRSVMEKAGKALQSTSITAGTNIRKLAETAQSRTVLVTSVTNEGSLTANFNSDFICNDGAAWIVTFQAKPNQAQSIAKKLSQIEGPRPKVSLKNPSGPMTVIKLMLEW
ncbi:MAG: hypothetical protein K2X47_13970 [Bdellovibrionales bacterium]|nr:hypothetical protein [Bdellovibrionales bacterium]